MSEISFESKGLFSASLTLTKRVRKFLHALKSHINLRGNFTTI